MIATIYDAGELRSGLISNSNNGVNDNGLDLGIYFEHRATGLSGSV